MFGKNRTVPVPPHVKHSLSLKTEQFNLLDAVNELLKLNKQGISAHMEGTIPGIQIKLNGDCPTALPLELWGTKIDDPTVCKCLGIWNPTIDDWQSQSWQVKH